jgi:flagellar biosynthesis/type III secretory pathway protein FliH
MSSLIKFGQTAGPAARFPAVRTLTFDAASPATGRQSHALAPEREEDPAISALRAQVAELTRQVLQLQTELETTADAAYEDGHQAALSVNVRDEEAARTELGRCLRAAQAAFETALGDTHRLGVALAQSAVAKILGEMPEGPAIVEAILRVQLERLRPEMVMSVSVSALDFENELELAALCSRLGGGALTLQRDRLMPRGDCRIELRLGHLEAGLGTQWQKLVAFCETLAAEPGAVR